MQQAKVGPNGPQWAKAHCKQEFPMGQIRGPEGLKWIWARVLFTPGFEDCCELLCVVNCSSKI